MLNDKVVPSRALFTSSPAQCIECDRIFNLLDDADAADYYYGHDCEV